MNKKESLPKTDPVPQKRTREQIVASIFQKRKTGKPFDPEEIDFMNQENED